MHTDKYPPDLNSPESQSASSGEDLKPTPTDSSVEDLVQECVDALNRLDCHEGDMRKQNIIRAALKSHTAELRKDKERLDWIENNILLHGAHVAFPSWFMPETTLRQAIDTAINQQNKT